MKAQVRTQGDHLHLQIELEESEKRSYGLSCNIKATDEVMKMIEKRKATLKSLHSSSSEKYVPVKLALVVCKKDFVEIK